MAKLIVTDLIEGDGAKLELLKHKELVKVLQDKNKTLDTLNRNLLSQIDNLNDILRAKEQNIEARVKIEEDLNAALVRVRRGNKLYKIGASFAIGTALVLFIQ